MLKLASQKNSECSHCQTSWLQEKSCAGHWGGPTDAYEVPPGVEQVQGPSPRWGSVKTGHLPGGVFFAELLKGIDLGSLVDNDVDLKMDDFNQNVLLMSPPASDSGSQAGFSPYSIDSEPGSPLLDEAKV